jgi:predicted transcriptional regulator
MATRNITLAIPKEILFKIKIMAAKQDTSISALLTEVLTQMVARDEGYQAARQRHLAMLDSGLNLDSQAVLGGNREQIHEC